MARNKVVKPNDGVKTLKRILKFIISVRKGYSFLVLVFIFISSIVSVISSLFLKSLIDDYILPIMKGNAEFSSLVNALFTMGVIYLTGILATYIYSWLLNQITQNSLKQLRDELFAHMEKLPIKYFDTHSHGDIMSVYTNDVDTLRQVISQSIPQFISSAITVVSVFVSMLVLSLPLTAIVIVMVVIMRFVTVRIAGQSAKYFNAQQKNLGRVNGYIEEMFEGQKVIKVFTHETAAKEAFDKINEDLFDSANEANKYANILMPIMGNLGNISYVLTALFGGVFAISGIGNLTLGGLASFLQLNRSFTMPVTQISQQLNAVIMALAGAERIFALMDEPVEVDDGKVTLCNVTIMEDGKMVESAQRTGKWAWKHPRENGEVSYVPLAGDVRFDDVIFGYNDDKIILHDINLYAQPGQKIAFVGATGAGKTTITNLINRFYDVQKGSITYDGIDVKLIKKDDLRSSLGIVLQDTHLFSGTIMDNIRYGKEDASDEEVIAASKLANAHGFIQHLEDGYHTVLKSDGSSLSQGQRQLLSIARAALANPPVLILDEATSSIDSRTEKIVQEGMDKLMEGRTVFVIAHRLSTIKNSNVIMVMDHGRIIERGDHDALLKEHGTYYQLYTGGLELE
ncbi:ATP-binding cassette subfamily B multidrug efflux pump [Breznakia sp. PF5-3]|uniref:ABC transporter ATP-binding protein n=1 Tax=unclassified Breznakia TaxID=2623764 RepID=UPI0024062E9D|nr:MULTISPECIES: ABC transporter ATP-binding protein [unclassified Breznakia]MDF9824093.1 ATP-binding cassette subfamily B multidrug efflux pump [Breznakia sp. PM6-1]MDF9834841.1 ATP-binding cassette subfamily B multidrug efflux pump [Breznakia sp. PF5-3]MDF9837137.1 ATP-binding cassette subfamily B multidrug efflux pump [Breznakia sp. PFB2-8]MDF9859062.1 ATP-binding cassette subfamily B multidrug efflux pump [Breznakia sp. PH5-24]